MHRRTVFIVDDHDVVRVGLTFILDKQGAAEYKVCGQTGSSSAAIQLIKDHRPDIVIMDIKFPHEISGVEVVREITANALHPPIFVMATHITDLSAIRRCFHAGARGYVAKHEVSSDLLDALRAVDQGDYYLSPSLKKRRKMAYYLQKPETTDDPKIALLTDRERQIFEMAAISLIELTEIAKVLGISKHTVEVHRKQISKKTRLRRVRDWIKYAAENLPDLA